MCFPHRDLEQKSVLLREVERDAPELKHHGPGLTASLVSLKTTSCMYGLPEAKPSIKAACPSWNQLLANRGRHLVPCQLPESTGNAAELLLKLWGSHFHAENRVGWSLDHCEPHKTYYCATAQLFQSYRWWFAILVNFFNCAKSGYLSFLLLHAMKASWVEISGGYEFELRYFKL